MMYNRYGKKYAIKHNENLQAAFKDLRDLCIIVAQKHLCCGGCASADLHEKAQRMSKNGLVVYGAVYFHEQDFDTARNYGKLYLGFGGHEDFETVTIGQLVVSALEAHGLKYEWNGKESQRILVQLT